MKNENIALKPTTKNKLDKIKLHPRETYDDIVRRLIKGDKNNGK